MRCKSNAGVRGAVSLFASRGLLLRAVLRLAFDGRPLAAAPDTPHCAAPSPTGAQTPGLLTACGSCSARLGFAPSERPALALHQCTPPAVLESPLGIPASAASALRCPATAAAAAATAAGAQHKSPRRTPPPAWTPPSMAAAPANDYEAQRQARIEANRRKMAEMGLLEASRSLSAAAAAAAAAPALEHGAEPAPRLKRRRVQQVRWLELYPPAMQLAWAGIVLMLPTALAPASAAWSHPTPPLGLTSRLHRRRSLHP